MPLLALPSQQHEVIHVSDRALEWSALIFLGLPGENLAAPV